MIFIGARITDAERLARIKKLGVSDAEAQEILAYDKAVEKDEPTQYDLTGEKARIAKTFAHTGTRKQPTAYKFNKRERKPNATKGGIINALADFLRNHIEFDVNNVEITNKEREILFKVGEDWYTVVLTYKRNMNKKK